MTTLGIGGIGNKRQFITLYRSIEIGYKRLY